MSMQNNETETMEITEGGQTARPPRSIPKGANVAYLVIAGVIFMAITVVFLCFPRTTYSELEKRDLAEFPDVGRITEEPARLTAEISQWFSDSEPYRDELMTFSMAIRDAMRYSLAPEEEQVTFRPSTDGPADGGAGAGGDEISEMANGMPVTENVDNPMANENAKISNAGIVIVGSGPKVRALMAFGGSEKSIKQYVDLINEYTEALPETKVYSLVAPLATEFYLPEKAKKCSKPQRPPIEYVRQHISPRARFVDAYSALAAHVNEDIYLRTDHHWAPLGGFYAAQELARTAGVPFKGLDSYDRHVIHNYVGTMYGYSKDIAVKNAPEDFVYHTPRGLNYTTTYVTYKANKNYQIVSETKPYAGPYFKHFKDGSGMAYLTFMGGDQSLVKVSTGTKSNRKLLVIKDSYGNTVPGYMFYSFGEVHVVDFRYFNRNIKQYVAENGITDLVILFNVFNTCTSSSVNKVRRFLTQKGGSYAPVTVEDKKPTSRDTVRQKPRKESPVSQEPPKTQEPAPEPVSAPAETPAETPPESPVSDPVPSETDGE